MLRMAVAASVGTSVLLVSALPAYSGGLEETVQVRDNEFDPAVVPSTTNPFLAGESLAWQWESGVVNYHDVRQLRGLFRSSLSNSPGTTFLRTFSSGTFPYECSIHGPAMSGIVKVRVWQGLAPSGLPLLRWAFSDTNTGKAFDVQFRIGEGRWRVWKKDTTRRYGVFGRNDKPVRYNPDREYWFRARSQKRANLPRAVSKWSPATLLD
jgi:plastocyanin